MHSPVLFVVGALIGFALSFGGWRMTRWCRARAVRRRWRGVAMVILPLLMLFGLGCANSSLQRCYQAKQVYASLTETAADLRDAGVIPQAQIVATKPYRVAARAALDGWEAAAKGGDVGVANTYEAKFKEASAFVQRLIDAYTPSKPHSEADYGRRSSYGFERYQVDRRLGGGGRGGESRDYTGRMGERGRQDFQSRRAA